MDKVKADLILLHAPAIYDFRGRDDIALGWYATQESSNVTPIFEMYPLGFLYLKNYLSQAGLTVEIVNLASLMLRHPTLDVEKLLEHLEAPIIGIDLHWLPHCHGSIEVAGLIKKVLPETLILFGGIVSTYYSKELMQYPQVDIVARGFDTLEPVRMLVTALKEGRVDFSGIPNVIYKSFGVVCDNGFHQLADTLSDVAIDWSGLFPEKCNLLNMPNLMVVTNTGCDNNCGWCSGAKYSYKRIMNATKRTVFHRNPVQIQKEIASFPKLEVPLSVYTLQSYSENDTQILSYLETIGKNAGVKSVSMEQFRLPKPKMMEEMMRVAPNTDIMINLSPQTHDAEISRLISGQPTYTMAEMETWLQQAFEIGIKGVYVWYTIGMPGQTYASVMETVEYTARLMEKFPDQQVIPSIFGMIPFLDPGCRFFDEPEKNGYRVFFKDLQSHREAMVQPLWINSMNYETDWLPRDKFLPCLYEASRKMANYKASFGRMTEKSNKLINARMDRIEEITRIIETVYQKDKKLPAWLRAEILAHNEDILSYAADVRLVKKPLTGRWYDDHTVSSRIIDACTTNRSII